MHARLTGFFVQEASQYESMVTISNGKRAVDAKRIFGVMGLAIKNGDTVTITVEGPDEQTAAIKLEAMMKEML